LSLVEGNPEIVPTEGARTVFYSPYLTPVVPTFNGTGWDRTLLSGPLRNDYDDTSKNPPMADGSCADLFVWNDNDTMRLGRGPSWSYTGAGRPPLQWINHYRTNGAAIPNGPAQNRGTWVGTIATWPDGVGHTYVRTNWPGAGAINQVWNAYNKKLNIARVMPGTSIGGGDVTGWSRTGLIVAVVVGEKTAMQIHSGCQASSDTHIIVTTINFNSDPSNPGVADNLGDGISYVSSGTLRGLSRTRIGSSMVAADSDPHAWLTASFMFGPGMSDFEMWTHGYVPRTFNISLVNPFSAIWQG
jgi:hypothetical protein